MNCRQFLDGTSQRSGGYCLLLPLQMLVLWQKVPGNVCEAVKEAYSFDQGRISKNRRGFSRLQTVAPHTTREAGRHCFFDTGICTRIICSMVCWVTKTLAN